MRSGSNVVDPYQQPVARPENAHRHSTYPPPQPAYRSQTQAVRPQQQSTGKPAHEPSFAPAEGWLPLLLLAVAAYSLVYVIITVNSTVVHASILIGSTAVGLIAGFAIAKIHRFPQALLHLGAILGGHWLSVWLTSSALHIPWTGLISAIGATITYPNGNQFGSIVFLFYLTFLSYFLAYFGAWLVYRAHLPWLLTIVYSAILLINLNVARAGQDFTLLLVVFLAALIALIARVQLADLLAQWRQAGLYTNRPWLRDLTARFMNIASVLTLLIVITGWLFPTLGQPPQGAALWQDINNAWTNVSQGHIPWQNPTQILQAYQVPTEFFGSQMAISGSVHLPSGEVLDYTSSAGGQYLAGFTYDHFDGHTWTSLSASNSANYNANVSLLDQHSPPGSVTSVNAAVTLVQPPLSAQRYIFAPFNPETFSVPATLYGIPIVSAWGQQSVLKAGEQYQVTSLVPTVSPSELAQYPLPGVDLRPWSTDSNYTMLAALYLQKPADITNTTRQTLLTWTKGATSAYDALKRIQDHLSNTGEFTYSLDNPPIPSNVDVVDWLLRTKQGYCTYYATAMTIMARMLGVPARIVNGFAPGTYDAQRRVWVVNGTDAHSWVQAYFPNYGWINFEPTPGYALTGSSHTPPAATPTATPHPHQPAATPTASRGQPQRGSQPPSLSGGSNPTSLNASQQVLLFGGTIILLLCSLAALLFALARYWWQNLYAKSPPIAAMFWRLSYVAGLLGFTSRPSQTPYEYGQRLCRAAPRQAPAIWRLTELFVRDRWATPYTPHPRAAEGELAKLRPGLRGVVARLVLYRLLRRK